MLDVDIKTLLQIATSVEAAFIGWLSLNHGAETGTELQNKVFVNTAFAQIVPNNYRQT